MKASDLIQKLQKLHPDTLVVLRNNDFMGTYRSPEVRETTLVEEREGDKFVDMSDRDRDQDIEAYIL